MENAQLSRDGPAIVVDPLTGETIIGVERVDSAKGELHSPTGCGETAPSAEVGTANDDFNDDSVVCNVALLDVDF